MKLIYITMRRTDLESVQILAARGPLKKKACPLHFPNVFTHFRELIKLSTIRHPTLPSILPISSLFVSLNVCKLFVPNPCFSTFLIHSTRYAYFSRLFVPNHSNTLLLYNNSEFRQSFRTIMPT